MKTLLVTAPKTSYRLRTFKKVFRSGSAQGMTSVSNKLGGWRVAAVSSGSLKTTSVDPDVTLVELNEHTKPKDVEALIPGLVQIQTRAAKRPKRSYILFQVKTESEQKGQDVFISGSMQGAGYQIARQISQYLSSFPQPELVNLTFATTPKALATELDIISTKIDLLSRLADTSAEVRGRRPSSLDKNRDLLTATEDLREENGKVSATAIAKAFGVSVNQLAAWLGKSRQAVSKTPDADSLQSALNFFERVARLRAVFSQDEFIRWLRTPNWELDNKTPLELLERGDRQVVADFAADMLTGAPA